MKMRATTIRFTPDLWELLEREAGREGVSVAQYLRDAALFRIAYAAGARGDRSGGPDASGARVPTDARRDD